MSATSTFIHDILEAAFKGETYTGGVITMGLFKTGLPSTTGVEISGGSYSRKTLTFAAASSKKIALSSSAVFNDLPTGSSNTIVAWGVYDDGVLIDDGTLSSPFTADVTNNTLTINYTFDLSGV